MSAQRVARARRLGIGTGAVRTLTAVSRLRRSRDLGVDRDRLGIRGAVGQILGIGRLGVVSFLDGLSLHGLSLHRLGLGRRVRGRRACVLGAGLGILRLGILLGGIGGDEIGQRLAVGDLLGRMRRGFGLRGIDRFAAHHAGHREE